MSEVAVHGRGSVAERDRGGLASDRDPGSKSRQRMGPGNGVSRRAGFRADPRQALRGRPAWEAGPQRSREVRRDGPVRGRLVAISGVARRQGGLISTGTRRRFRWRPAPAIHRGARRQETTDAGGGEAAVHPAWGHDAPGNLSASRADVGGEDEKGFPAVRGYGGGIGSVCQPAPGQRQRQPGRKAMPG